MRKNRSSVIISTVLLFLAILCVLFVSVNKDHSQSLPARQPMEASFLGEYSWDGFNWQPLNDLAQLSAKKDELYLRGHFDAPIEKDLRINFFLNHLGVEVHVNNEPLYRDALMESGKTHPSVCGKKWAFFLSPGLTTSDVVEFRLRNFHSFATPKAFSHFLTTICLTPDTNDVLMHFFAPLKSVNRNYAILMLLSALILLIAAVVFDVFHLLEINRLWNCGLLCAFAGGFVLCDIPQSPSSELTIAAITYVRHFCMMFFMLWLGFSATGELSGRIRKVACAGNYMISFANAVFILLSLMGKIVIYETLNWWMALQSVVSAVMLGSCIFSFRHSKSPQMSWRLFLHTLLFAVFFLDYAGRSIFVYSRGAFLRIAFLFAYVCYVVMAVKQILKNQQKAADAARLQKDLDESRLSIMISQIQPHFIYNTLGTIHHLCLHQAEEAAHLVQEFSLYLRGNFDEITNRSPIRLSREIEHVKHYVNIEKIRFPDMQITFDLQTDDFVLPALSIQPLVENAIKHGLMGLESGGNISVSTYETLMEYCVLIKDDGVGFRPEMISDERKHIGIANIRTRLETMCGGKLHIESNPGKGTTALIILPKEKQYDSNHSR